MRIESNVKRAVVFVDGQNLYHCAKTAFGYTYPNYDIDTLCKRICVEHGWQLSTIRFYTGVPNISDNAFWHAFWSAKLAYMGKTGIHVYSRPLRYRNQVVTLPDGRQHTFLVGEEKGIDVRIALDIINFAHKRTYDVALLLSQDQDLSEVADELRIIAKEQNRWLKIASAFPHSPTVHNARGINNTDWVKIDRALYDACLDPRDYR